MGHLKGNGESVMNEWEECVDKFGSKECEN